MDVTKLQIILFCVIVPLPILFGFMVSEFRAKRNSAGLFITLVLAILSYGVYTVIIGIGKLQGTI